MFRDPNVESGIIIEDLKDRFLCQIKGTDIFYHIKKDGHIIVYCDTDHQEDELPSVKSELREGVFFLDVNLLADTATRYQSGINKKSNYLKKCRVGFPCTAFSVLFLSLIYQFS